MSTLFTKFAMNELTDVLQSVNYSTNFANNKQLSVSVGRVFGVVTTTNTPSPSAFNDSRVGGYSGIGSIFFKSYIDSKDEINDESDSLFSSCNVASPLFPNIMYYPLIGELVYVLYLPSAGAQENKQAGTFYYLSPINLWSNNSVNSQAPNPNASLGKTFIENPNVRNLLSFEGDFILQGRKGNSIRLGASVKKLQYLNEWSDFGLDGDPITILYNGKGNADNQDYSIEKINNPGISAIYLTTSQRIPLEVPSADIKTYLEVNSRSAVNKYDNSPQAIITADRVVLNAKKDKILLFADKNIELSTKSPISLNSDSYIHLNTKAETGKFNTVLPKVLLGTKNDGSLPDEPLVLGDQLDDFLSELLENLSRFAAQCTNVTAPQEGSPITELQSAAEALFENIGKMYDKVEKIKSKSNFTV
jgi:hypothetical protein